MAVVEEKHFLPAMNDEDDALLDEAICCNTNKTSETHKTDHQQSKNERPDITLNLSRPLWCDMDVDSNSGSDASNSKSANNSSSFSDQSLHEDEDKSQPIQDDKKKEISVKQETGVIVKQETTESVQENGLSTKESKENSSLNNNTFDRKRVRQPNAEEELGNVAKQFRSRADSGSTHSSSSAQSNGSNPKRIVEYETDPVVLTRRQKDIDYGKNTIGYDRYIQLIPKDKRTKEHPRTPPLHIKNSRRGWDGQVKLWRKQLHLFDPEEEEDTKVPIKSEKTDNLTDKTNSVKTDAVLKVEPKDS